MTTTAIDTPSAPARKGRKPPRIPPELLPEHLNAASPERPACVKCGLWSTCRTPFLRPYVPQGWTRRILLVGEAPGADEDGRSGRPFTGRAGQLLRRLWRAAGYRDVDVALVNAVRCRPPVPPSGRGNSAPSMSAVRACRPFLLRTIEVLRPDVVMGLGTTAARSLTNDGGATVTSSRGRALTIPGLLGMVAVQDLRIQEQGEDAGGGTPRTGPRVFVTYHPAAVLHGAAHLADAIRDDLRRIADPVLPHPREAVPTGTTVAVDVEWAKDGTLLDIAFADDRVAFATAPDDQEHGGPSAAEILRNTKVLVGASVAGDVEQLAAAGLPIKDTWADGRDVRDSILLARTVDENAESYELENQLLARYRTEPWKQETEPYNWVRVTDPETGRTKRIRDVDAARWPADLRARRCRLDAWAAYLNARDAQRALPPTVSADLMEFTHRVAAAVSRMTIAGMVVDAEKYAALGGELEAAVLRTRDQLAKAAVAAGMTEEFAPSNDGHIRELLFARRGLPVLRTTDTGLPSVAKDTLKQYDDPVVRLLLEYNAAEKLHSTNIVGIRDLLRPIGILEGIGPAFLLPVNLNPLGARTGRRSSKNPNTQNWNKRMRGMVRSRHPRGLIGAPDYSKLEPIILGWYAQEPVLIEAFGPGGGGYAYFAKGMWGFDCGDETPEYRATKSILLGVHYNMQQTLMAEKLWVLGVRFSADYEEHVAETDRLRRKYLQMVPRVMEYMERQEAFLLEHGYVVSASGRVRHLPCPDGRRTPGFGHMLNQAINFPVQELASVVTGSALLDITDELRALHGLSPSEYLALLLRGRNVLVNNMGVLTDTAVKDLYPLTVPINEVHDEITLDIHPDYLVRDTELIIETMRAVPTFHRLVPGFDAPLNASWKATRYWAQKD